MGSSHPKGETPKDQTNKEQKETSMSPDEIQDLIKTKKNLEAQITNLAYQNQTLQKQLNVYLKSNQTIQGNFQNLQNAAYLNMNQASQQIQILQDQNTQLMSQKNNLEQKMISLNVELEKYKFYCNKMQLMCLNNMQQISMNDNINSWQKMNNPSNNNMNNNMNSINNMNNINNNMNMNNSPNFNYQNPENTKTIIFNVNNKMKCPIATLPNHKLGNIFILALYQNGFSNFVNINSFTFRFNTQNISNLFYQNKEVKELHLGGANFPIIDVSGF